MIHPPRHTFQTGIADNRSRSFRNKQHVVLGLLLFCKLFGFFNDIDVDVLCAEAEVICLPADGLHVVKQQSRIFRLCLFN